MFNIVTPSYNRSHTLRRVYDSLLNQTFKQFTWIIIDDGSQDGTRKLVEEWIDSSKIKIRYHYLDINQGKAKAVNFGLTLCTEPYTIIADSDDTFDPISLDFYRNIWNIVNLSNNKIGTIWTLVIDEKNEIKGDKFPKDFWQVNFKQRVLDLKREVHGDKWHCWKTEVLKNYPFYSQKNCHIGESHTWNKINKNYDFLCLNVPLLKAHYTEDSLITSKKSRKEVAIGYYYSSYYGLRDIKWVDIISYRHYRYLAFEYIKSKLYFSDRNIKLSFSKTILCFVIFALSSPKRLLYKI